MKIVLYDEGMYPSGSAHGMVVAENPDYASKGITLSDKPEGGEVITEFSDGKYLVYGFTGEPSGEFISERTTGRRARRSRRIS